MSNPSFSNDRMMTETVCGDRPVRRAISDFGRLLRRRTRDSTRRSLWARTRVWFAPPLGSMILSSLDRAADKNLSNRSLAYNHR